MGHICPRVMAVGRVGSNLLGCWGGIAPSTTVTTVTTMATTATATTTALARKVFLEIGGDLDGDCCVFMVYVAIFGESRTPNFEMEFELGGVAAEVASRV